MLSKPELAALLNDALRKADAQSAPDDLKGIKGQHTKQRIEFARALAETIIDYIVENAEVVVPDHDPFRTEVVPGPGPHAHPVVVPLKHHHGKIV